MGIPVTTRGVARTFAVVTGQTDPTLECDIDFHALSKMDTIVVLMGRKNILQLTMELIATGMSPATPAASIENATLPSQRAVPGSLADIAAKVDEAGLKSPMISVIGIVAGMIDENSAGLPAEIERALSFK